MLQTPTVFANEFIEIFLAVVVGELFTGFDRASGVDEDFVTFYLDFAVRAAGMVDVPRDVFARGAVDGFAIPNFKKVFSTDPIGLIFGNDVTPVLNNESALWDGDVGKHA